MKKLFAAALALAMALGLSTTAFAVGGSMTVTGTGAQNPIDVTAKYNDGATTPKVYSVDLIWEDMTFTYSESGTKTWDPDTHTYSGTTASWDKTSASVRAFNHSNAAVTVSFTYQPKSNTGVSGSITPNYFNLAAGVENDPDRPDQADSVLTITGTPNDTVTAEGIVVGTITVTITGG